MFAEYDTEEAVLYDEIEWVADIPNQPGLPLPVDDLHGEDLEEESTVEMDAEEAPGDNLDLAAPAVPAVPALLPAPTWNHKSRFREENVRLPEQEEFSGRVWV